MVFSIALVWGALAAPSFALVAPGPSDITNCDDCQNLVNVDVDSDGRVTTADLLIVYSNIQKKIYTAASDVNSDGLVNMDDFTIVKRCLGCTVSASPFN
ncbi:dockerin type I domain-containing protein [Desulfatiglans anilini]|uniref:dockerin type I domain-containing protein n=1 Tax=Desulfatiglans anilini TaxID=90728 RepID=UPI0004010134|nr:dockerin type I domain-containing protein [Desulfatiglans anilini]